MSNSTNLVHGLQCLSKIVLKVGVPGFCEEFPSIMKTVLWIFSLWTLGGSVDANTFDLTFKKKKKEITITFDLFFAPSNVV